MKIGRRVTSKAIGLASIVLMVAIPNLAQTNAVQRPPAISAADRLGLTCAQILELTSTDWTAKFTQANAQAKASPEDSTRRAVTVYGKCYDSRTDNIAAALAKKGAGPTKKARLDFLSFDAAVKAFASKALADVQPLPDPTKTAYVLLCEKQFRREFYTEYEQKTVSRALTPDESEQYRKAKNRFGELLGLLPEEKGHEVHEAFGDIVGSHSVSLPMNLALYRYAIFILEPPSDKPFAPPPF